MIQSYSAEFKRLAQQWKLERPRGADVTDMVMHPAYQRIIGLGPRAVPLILAQLEREPAHWFWALHAITGADPVPTESQGRLREMSDAWIAWGRKQGYKWGEATTHHSSTNRGKGVSNDQDYDGARTAQAMEQGVHIRLPAWLSAWPAEEPDDGHHESEGYA